MTEIPTVDLSPFLIEGSTEEEKMKAMEVIRKACSEYGFFQAVNHGVPPALISRALDLSHTFFTYPLEEKLKSRPLTSMPLPAGYNLDFRNSQEKNETFILLPPKSSINVYPQNPPDFKEIVEDLFSSLSKTASMVENILSDCLGLPSNFFNEFNDDGSWDFILMHHYDPAIGTDNLGLSPHEDGNILTLVFQDEAGGLEVMKDGDWTPVPPTKDAIIINIGDVIQVLSNNKLKSATHRVVRPKGRNRSSYALFRNPHGDKWVEPLPKFANESGESPEYRGFFFKEYQQLRVRNKTHPPLRPQDSIRITHYAITK